MPPVHAQKSLEIQSFWEFSSLYTSSSSSSSTSSDGGWKLVLVLPARAPLTSTCLQAPSVSADKDEVCLLNKAGSTHEGEMKTGSFRRIWLLLLLSSLVFFSPACSSALPADELTNGNKVCFPLLSSDQIHIKLILVQVESASEFPYIVRLTLRSIKHSPYLFKKPLKLLSNEIVMTSKLLKGRVWQRGAIAGEV